jgi:hypothetical protein
LQQTPKSTSSGHPHCDEGRRSRGSGRLLQQNIARDKWLILLNLNRLANTVIFGDVRKGWFFAVGLLVDETLILFVVLWIQMRGTPAWLSEASRRNAAGDQRAPGRPRSLLLHRADIAFLNGFSLAIGRDGS